MHARVTASLCLSHFLSLLCARVRACRCTCIARTKNGRCEGKLRRTDLQLHQVYRTRKLEAYFLRVVAEASALPADRMWRVRIELCGRELRIFT